MPWNVFFVLLGVQLANSVGRYSNLERESVISGYFVSPPPQDAQQTPLETMVEITNNLGVTILKDNSISRGNYAFSPYGVASVLVVLYEGAREQSAEQIKKAVGFPPDKQIIRIGFSLIHRHLQDYFSHEGFLSGISLNKENSNLRFEYKKILEMYGYDVDRNQMHFDEDENPEDYWSTEYSSISPETVSETSSGLNLTTEGVKHKDVSTGTPQNDETTTEAMRVEDSVTEMMKDNETLTVVIPNENATTEAITEEITTEKKEETTETTAEAVQSKRPTTELMENEESTTETIKDGETTRAETAKNDETTTEALKNEEGNAEAIKDNSNPNNGIEDEAKRAKATKKKATVPPDEQPTTERSSKASKKGNESGEKHFVEQQQTTAATDLDNGMLIPQEIDLPSKSVPTPESRSLLQPMTFLETSNTINLSNVTQSAGQQQKQPKFSQNLKNIKNIVNGRISLWLDESMRKKRRRKRTLTRGAPGRSRGLPRLPFLVDGTVHVSVPMMTFTNVFPYAYIPWLHSKALVFPLDDVRYKLLLLSPVERRGLSQLINDLAEFRLSTVLQFLRPSVVRAVVPTFEVEGYVVFTSSLKKLGILDVFDPLKANLSGMTTDPQLYVRNVEQSVTVVIRNYVEISDVRSRTTEARHLEYEFEATHPFLYFVLDSSTNVALMAGQMLNPLYSRLY